MTSADANNIEEGSRRTFVPKPPPRTYATTQTFGDAFKKVDDGAALSPPARSKKSGRAFT